MSAYFEWGTTTSYGDSSPPVQVGSGTTTIPESYQITALTPGITYHYRIVGTQDGLTAYGLDRHFTALPPPLALTERATMVSATAEKVYGVVNPLGVATTYQFEYGPTTSYGQMSPEVTVSASAGQTKVSAGLNGLSANAMTYHYRLVATLSGGYDRRRRPHVHYPGGAGRLHRFSQTVRDQSVAQGWDQRPWPAGDLLVRVGDHYQLRIVHAPRQRRCPNDSGARGQQDPGCRARDLVLLPVGGAIRRRRHVRCESKLRGLTQPLGVTVQQVAGNIGQVTVTGPCAPAPNTLPGRAGP
jgi:hypothetical protein